MKTATLAQKRTTKNSEILHNGLTFPFLELPPELRNVIYDKVAEDHELHLHRGKVMGQSNLITANRQIREEYLALYPLGGSSLVAVVDNFDISEIVVFINEIRPGELEALPTLEATGRRTAVALKRFTAMLSSDLDDRDAAAMLSSWLGRWDNPSKKGTMLDITYETTRRIS